MTRQNQYDVCIVGSGPAGVSAARTAARLGFNTVVVERLAQPGGLSHACHGIVAPAPSLVSGRSMLDGLFFPQLDLWIPDSLIRAENAGQRCVSPSGLEFQTAFMGSEDAQAAVIDKSGVLVMMAEQANSQGAEFRFDTDVTELLWEGDRVAGVRTSDGDIYAHMVMAADGAQGQLSEQAGVFERSSLPGEAMLLVSFELEAPAARAEQAGRLVTLGGWRALADRGFGQVIVTEPGRAMATFTSYVEELSCAVNEPAVALLREYMQDERTQDLLAGARVVSQTSQLLPLREAPGSVVRNNFMAVGDAIAPAGYLGILPSIYLGRQAALIAAEALDQGEADAGSLLAFDRIYRDTVLPGLQAEGKMMSALVHMKDGELDRLAEILNALHLGLPLFGAGRAVEWDTIRWLIQEFPRTARDRRLLYRVFEGLRPSLEPQPQPMLDNLPELAAVSTYAM